MTLQLIKNPDVLATICHTYPDLICVGFAAETQDANNCAKSKLAAKQLDMIAVNDVSDKTIGFGSENNAMTVFAEQYDQMPQNLPKAHKSKIAEQLVACVVKIMNQKQ